jgi:hypothetical protein
MVCRTGGEDQAGRQVTIGGQRRPEWRHVENVPHGLVPGHPPGGLFIADGQGGIEGLISASVGTEMQSVPFFA